MHIVVLTASYELRVSRKNHLRDHPSYIPNLFKTPVPEIIDPVFTKTSQNARFLLSENERFGLVFVKTGSIISGTVPKIIDPVFAKTSPNRSFCMTENERFGLAFVKTGSINSGTGTGQFFKDDDILH
jgi:hypothetical protein